MTSRQDMMDDECMPQGYSTALSHSRTLTYFQDRLSAPATIQFQHRAQRCTNYSQHDALQSRYSTKKCHV